MAIHRINLNNISIILKHPKFPENIGSAARAMKNMGISDLIVVTHEKFDLEPIHKLSTHAAADIVDNMTICSDFPMAVGSFRYVVGTTARLGGQRQHVYNPSEMAEKLITISEHNRIAFVFGPEDRGLENEDLRLCHALVHINTAEFSSINLAQSVMIICYELFKTSLPGKMPYLPRLASRFELEGMYDQLKEILVKTDYILPENPDYWMNKIRHFLSDYPLKAREVSIIRGICRQINWYGEKRFQDGLKESKGIDNG